MTPEQALHILRQGAAEASATLSQHNHWQNAANILAQALKEFRELEKDLEGDLIDDLCDGTQNAD